MRAYIAGALIGISLYRFVSYAIAGNWLALIPAALIVFILWCYRDKPARTASNKPTLEQQLQEARAAAWDEGALRVINHNRWVNLVTPTDNPYRTTNQEPTS